MANVTIMGLGPVGLATAWDLLRNGANVIAYDSDPIYRERLQKGNFSRAPAIAEDLREAMGSRLSFIDRLAHCAHSDTVIICIGTPANSSGFDLSGVTSALKSARLEKGRRFRRHFIVRSTLLPGTAERELMPLLSMGEEFDFSYYPEFLRERFLREDIDSPPLNIACHSSAEAGQRFARLFPRVSRHTKSFAVAEAVKLASNAFHAMKVVFANEVSDICEDAGASAEEVMSAFREDTKLNISGLYLDPGGPFAGACLGKDLSALEARLDEMKRESPLLRSLRKSNEERAARGRKCELTGD